MTRNHLLSGIYKASQCTDINDCIIALAQARKVAASLKCVRGQSRSVYIRINSLEKRLKSFQDA